MIRVSLFAEHEREAVAPSGAYRLQMSPRAGQVRMVGNFAAGPAALAQPPKPTVRRSRQS